MAKLPDLNEESLRRAFSSPAKCLIVAACVRRALSAKSISDSAGQPLASTYRQIKALVGDGVLFVERSAMTADGKPYDLYRSRVRNAKMELSADKVRVSWEPNVAVGERIKGLWGGRAGDGNT